MSDTQRASLEEVAAMIGQHLRAFERDPEANKPDALGHPRFFQAQASVCGCCVLISYNLWATEHCLPRSDAERYLVWLDAGGVGRHLDMEAKR